MDGSFTYMQNMSLLWGAEESLLETMALGEGNWRRR